MVCVQYMGSKEMNEWRRISNTSWKKQNPSKIHYDHYNHSFINELKLSWDGIYISQAYIIVTSQVHIIFKENLEDF